MSFYHLPHPWDPRYAIPRSVMAEPPERGTFTTQWLPRGTISELIPDYLAQPTKLVRQLGSLGGSTLSGPTLKGSTLAHSSLSGDTLGATAYRLEPLGQSAELVTYGKNAAKELMAYVKQRVPPAKRAAVLKAAMATVDPSLPTRAEKLALEARRRGVPAPQALEHGIATAMTQSLHQNLGRIGRMGRGSRLPPQSSSLQGLGRNHDDGAYEDLGGLGSFLKKVGKVIVRVVAAPVTFGASEAYINREAIKKLADKAGDAACKAIGKIPPVVGQAAGSTPNPQAQAVGAGIAISQALCAAGQPLPPPPSASSYLPWVLGGAAVLGVVALVAMGPSAPRK